MKIKTISRSVIIDDLPFFPFNSEALGLDFISLTLPQARELRDLLTSAIVDLEKRDDG